MDSDAISDLFSGLGPVDIRRLFGGKGIYHNGVIIAVEIRGELRLKADDQLAAEYAAAGCKQCAQVDHYPVPRWAGGPDDPANLVASCRGCNLSPKAKAAAGKKAPPNPVPPCPPGISPGVWPQSRQW